MAILVFSPGYTRSLKEELKINTVPSVVILLQSYFEPYKATTFGSRLRLCLEICLAADKVMVSFTFSLLWIFEVFKTLLRLHTQSEIVSFYMSYLNDTAKGRHTKIVFLVSL